MLVRRLFWPLVLLLVLGLGFGSGARTADKAVILSVSYTHLDVYKRQLPSILVLLPIVNALLGLTMPSKRTSSVNRTFPAAYNE